MGITELTLSVFVLNHRFFLRVLGHKLSEFFGMRAGLNVGP